MFEMLECGCNPATECAHFDGAVVRFDHDPTGYWVWTVIDPEEPGNVTYHGPSEEDARTAFATAFANLVASSII